MGYCAYCGHTAAARCMTCGRKMCNGHRSRSLTRQGEYLLGAIQHLLSGSDSPGIGLDYREQCTECDQQQYQAALADIAEVVRDLPPAQGLLALVCAGSSWNLNSAYRSIEDIWALLGRSWPGTSLLQGVLHAFRCYRQEVEAGAPTVVLELVYQPGPNWSLFGSNRHLPDPVRETHGNIRGWAINLGNHGGEGPHYINNRGAFLRPDGEVDYGPSRLSESGRIASTASQSKKHKSRRNTYSSRTDIQQALHQLHELARRLSHAKHLNSTIECPQCEIDLAGRIAVIAWPLVRMSSRRCAFTRRGFDEPLEVPAAIAFQLGLGVEQVNSDLGA